MPAWQAAGEGGFILIPFSEVWDAELHSFLKDREHACIFRSPFKLNAARFWEQYHHLPPLPQDFELRRMDQALLRQAGGMPFWASAADFLQGGIGYCILKGNEIASTCTSVFATRAVVEIDVHTAEAYRGQVLAAARLQP